MEVGVADKLDGVTEMGLQFFGRISASVSHEIKNVLAIVNENAGLLEDLAFMANRGKPIDASRLITMAAAVKRQVGRADEILKNMNRFAHSIDQTTEIVALDRTIDLVIALNARLAAMRHVKVDLQRPVAPLTIQTSSFYLINLLSLCLDFAMSASGDEKRVEIFAEEADSSVQIRFRRLADLEKALLEPFPSDREQRLMTALKACLTAEPGAAEMVLRLEGLAE
jgi:C4-dicarboxylate-specific signal transduction histidine kinase